MPLPDAPSVQEILDRVLTSETFSRSERARALLLHLVHLRLSGETARLKGAVIAVELFQKDVADNSVGDSVVRVQMGRLRELLARYYAREGQGDGVRISIARGSYVPLFSFATPSEENVGGTVTNGDEESLAFEAPTAPSSHKAAGSRPRYFSHAFVQRASIAAIFLIALGVGLFAYVGPNQNTSKLQMAEAAPAGPNSPHGDIDMMALLPSVSVAHLSSEENTSHVADILEQALPGFDAINFFHDELSASRSVAGLDDLAFVFDVTHGVQANSVLLNLRHAASGQILSTSIFQPSDLVQPALNEKVSTILSSTVGVTGSIYAFAKEHANMHELMLCLWLFEKFKLDVSESAFDEAYRCFDMLAEKKVISPVILSQRAAMLAYAAGNGYAFPPEASLDDAVEMANAAAQIGPVSALTLRDLAFVYRRIGRYGEAVRWSQRAYELNPFNWSTAAAYGASLALTGQYLESVRLIEPAIANSPSYPDWWDLALFQAYLMMGDNAGVIRAAAAIETSGRPDYLAARIIGLHMSGDTPAARQQLTWLHERFPDFAKNPEAAMERLRMPKRIIDRVLDNLLAAGLQQGS